MYARMQLVQQAPGGPLTVSYPTWRSWNDNPTNKAAQQVTLDSSPFAGAKIDLPAMSTLVEIPAPALPDGFMLAASNQWIPCGPQQVLIGIDAASRVVLMEWLDENYMPPLIPYNPQFV